MKKYLIINADDYGSCFAANEAIERLFDRGAITTTTLMVPCPWAEDAIRRAQRNPRIKSSSGIGAGVSSPAQEKGRGGGRR